MLRLIILLVFVVNINDVLTGSQTTQSSSNNCNSNSNNSNNNNNNNNNKKCGQNEVYDVCPSSCPPRTCKTKDVAFRCKEPLKPGHPNCPRPICRCAEGFYSNNEGKCVKKEQCPPTCGLNEVPSDCANSPCIKNCATKDLNYQCKPNPSSCKPGCVCADTYYRNDNGTCVPSNQCPLPECGPNEVLSDCANSPCIKDCASKDLNDQCRPYPPGCKPGCVCADTYFRDDNGICVPSSQCPPKSCGPNEVYDSCPRPNCQTCETIGRPVPCPLIADYKCNGRCVCQSGYYRNIIGQCISEENCKMCQGPNEYFSCDNACDNECDKLSKRNHTSCPIFNVRCNEMCYCEEGYARNASNICVPISQCPPECDGENEEYSYCPNEVCRPKTCDDLGYPLSCYQFDRNTSDCGQPRCICKGGFVRNKHGVCISSRDCPSCKGDKNAWSGCGTFCTTCTNYKNKNIACILSCQLNGCDCRPGFVYNANTRKCVLPSQCPPTCGPNEVASDCVNNPCLTKNCAQKNLNIQCKFLKPKTTPSSCEAGCLCVDGYLRADNGTCVPRNQCPLTCGPNEVPSDCINGGCDKRNCTQLNQPAVCIDLVEGACVKGCVCQEGYLRTEEGVCVPVNQCPITCGPNEVPSDCINGGCDKRNCSQLGRPAVCIDLVEGACIKGCVCQPGYLRTARGVCVPSDKCPSNEVCSKRHEYYDTCPPSCPARQCNIDDRLILCKPPSPTAGCNIPSCRCEAGYYRNSYGDCVTYEECGINCGPNEIYYPCPQPTCAAQTCENIGKRFNCPFIPANYTCKGECRCQPNFYRNKAGQCISEEECKNQPQCGTNEVYDLCPPSCPPRTCETKDRVYKCSAPLKPGDPKCAPAACRCADNYYRNSNGKCVTKEECPECNDENAEYSYCPNQVCRPKTCDDLGFPLPCYQFDKPSDCGKPRCICKGGFVFNKDGVCIPSSDCPSCGGDKNAQPGCGTFCTRCTNYKNKARACPASCILNGCECRPNYVYDANRRKCVLPNQCPLTCGPNEVSSKCANDPCIVKNCSQKDLNFKCKQKTCGCKPGCLCADGYLRADNGTCIKRSQCPPICGPNEVPSNCINGGCEKRNCTQLGQPDLCIDLVEGACIKGCVCQPGYLRTAQGVCVQQDKCPSKEVCPRQHEYYDTCPPSCPARRCGIDDRGVFCPTRSPNAKCKPSCRCDQGYYRNEYGECVTYDECSSTPPKPISELEDDFKKGNALFTAKFLKAVVDKNPGKSVIVSAYSLLLLLSELALFAKGLTLKEFLSALNLKTPNEIRTVMPSMLQTLNEQKNVTVRYAFRNYGNILSNFSEGFKKETLEFSGAEAENIDFSDPEAAANKINAWVENATSNAIKNLVPADMLSRDTELVMVNALFFLAEWSSKFNPDNTRPGEFFVSADKSVTLDFMHQVTYMKYAELPDLKAKAVELSYTNRNFSCVIFLPNDRGGVQSLMSELVDPDVFNSVISALQPARVDISLPKFNTTTVTDLKEIMTELGMGQLYNASSTDLEGILADGRGIRGASGIQKAIVEINESGSKAAAANAIIGVATSAVISPPEVFNADQCFIYYILYYGTPIFCGLFAGDLS